MTRAFRRLPACSTVEEAGALAEAIGGGRLVLHSTPSVPVVGCVELLLGEAGQPVADEARGLERRAAELQRRVTVVMPDGSEAEE